MPAERFHTVKALSNFKAKLEKRSGACKSRTAVQKRTKGCRLTARACGRLVKAPTQGKAQRLHMMSQVVTCYMLRRWVAERQVSNTAKLTLHDGELRTHTLLTFLQTEAAEALSATHPDAERLRDWMATHRDKIGRPTNVNTAFALLQLHPAGLETNTEHSWLQEATRQWFAHLLWLQATMRCRELQDWFRWAVAICDKDSQFPAEFFRCTFTSPTGRTHEVTCEQLRLLTEPYCRNSRLLEHTRHRAWTEWAAIADLLATPRSNLAELRCHTHVAPCDGRSSLAVVFPVRPLLLRLPTTTHTHTHHNAPPPPPPRDKIPGAPRSFSITHCTHCIQHAHTHIHAQKHTYRHAQPRAHVQSMRTHAHPRTLALAHAQQRALDSNPNSSNRIAQSTSMKIRIPLRNLSETAVGAGLSLTGYHDLAPTSVGVGTRRLQADRR